MKKLLVAALVFVSTLSNSQNLQLMYDFGDDREYVTGTLEMFKPDDWGSTFYFADFELGANQDNSGDAKFLGDDKAHTSVAYVEIARGLKFWDAPFEYTVEYNGGLTVFKPLGNAYLTGPAFIWNAEDFSKGFTIKALYKHIDNSLNHSDFNWQITGVWYYNHSINKEMSLSFTGFCDVWSERAFAGGKVDDYITFLSEPQLWLNVNKHLSIGGEVELSNNFITLAEFKVRPAFGMKWNF